MNDKKYRAINFDLKISKLRQFYSDTNPKGAYGELATFFADNDFEHRQYSGYRSQQPLSDMEVFAVFDKLFCCYPWLGKCAEVIDVTTIESVYDILSMRKEQMLDSELSKDCHSKEVLQDDMLVTDIMKQTREYMEQIQFEEEIDLEL